MFLRPAGEHLQPRDDKVLDAAILDARMDAGVEVIVLTRTERFCAGANIAMLETADPTWSTGSPARERNAVEARAHAEA